MLHFSRRGVLLVDAILPGRVWALLLASAAICARCAHPAHPYFLSSLSWLLRWSRVNQGTRDPPPLSAPPSTFDCQFPFTSPPRRVTSAPRVAAHASRHPGWLPTALRAPSRLLTPSSLPCHLTVTASTHLSLPLLPSLSPSSSFESFDLEHVHSARSPLTACHTVSGGPPSLGQDGVRSRGEALARRALQRTPPECHRGARFAGNGRRCDSIFPHATVDAPYAGNASPAPPVKQTRPPMAPPTNSRAAGSPHRAVTQMTLPERKRG